MQVINFQYLNPNLYIFLNQFLQSFYLQMSTEIIKLKTNSNLKEAFSKIYRKFSNTNSQLTLIIKKSLNNDDIQNKDPKFFPIEQINHDQNNVIYQHLDQQIQGSNSGNNTSGQQHIQKQKYKNKQQKQNENQLKKLQSLCKIIGFDENSKQQLPVLIKNNDFSSINDSFNICISTKLIFPNIQFTQRTDGRIKNENKMIKSQKKNINSMKNSKLNKSTAPQLGKSKFKSKYTHCEQKFDKNTKQSKEKNRNVSGPLTNNIQQYKNKEQSPNSQAAIFNKLIKKQIQKQDDYLEELCSEVFSEQNSSTSVQQSIPQSLFVVEDKLNDAISYINMNKIFQLEEYLYQFKTKYICLSDRVEIKWRLLMAHCKQYRKQYDRASILYQQVLQMAKGSPKSLLIQPAQIYHRLGICFTQIGKWNDGIQAFAQALKGFKKSDKNMKYAQCMNNLGTLYLAAYQIQQAQKCFLLSYQIKINQCLNPSKLISSLLNLYECNLILHNYEQAEQVLKQTQKIIIMVKDNSMLGPGLQRRKGKLLFLKGELQQATKSYTKALQQIKNYPYSLQYAQLCSNFALLKLQQQKVIEARELFLISLGILNFYYTKDSQQIKNIRANIQLIEKIGQKTTSCRIINNSDVYTRKDYIQQCKNIE